VANVHNRSNGDGPDLRDSLDEPQPTGNVGVDEVLRRYWSSIKTFHKRRHVVDIINIRAWNGARGDVGDSLFRLLKRAWDNVLVRSKVNCSAGCVLKRVGSDEYRYYHSSENNASLRGPDTRVDHRGPGTVLRRTGGRRFR